MFEDVSLKTDYNYISSRIRLVRNIDSFVFPSKLDAVKSQALLDGMFTRLADIGEAYDKEINISYLHTMPDIEKQTLKERRVINSAIAAKKTATGLMYSDEEDISLTLNGEDHIRLQLLSSGLNIEELRVKADSMDDYINERFNYAYNDKFGYLSSYPTNIGTGIRANIVLHLPALSTGKNFSTFISGIISRFGVSIKPVYSGDGESYGALYDISNPKTLGASEKEIVDQIRWVAAQLNQKENEVRSISIKDFSMPKKDEAYRAYGLLKYARKLSLKETLNSLSELMRAVADGFIHTDNDKGIYALMLAAQASNILNEAKRPLSKEEFEIKRAEYIREIA